MIETIFGLTLLAGVKYTGYRLFQSVRQSMALSQAAKLERKIEPLPEQYKIKKEVKPWFSMREVDEILDQLLDYDARGELFNNRVPSTHSRIIKKSRKIGVQPTVSLPPPPPRRKRV